MSENRLPDYQAIIQAAGGERRALDCAPALLEKINRLGATGKYAALFAQLRSDTVQ